MAAAPTETHDVPDPSEHALWHAGQWLVPVHTPSSPACPRQTHPTTTATTAAHDGDDRPGRLVAPGEEGVEREQAADERQAHRLEREQHPHQRFRADAVRDHAVDGEMEGVHDAGRLAQQEPPEAGVVAGADARADEEAVVVEALHAACAVPAVLGAGSDRDPADAAAAGHAAAAAAAAHPATAPFQILKREVLPGGRRRDGRHVAG